MLVLDPPALMALAALVMSLAALIWSVTPSANEVGESFRRLVYSATELFDFYAQLLPDRLRKGDRQAKAALSSYKSAAKRLREPWALMCNKFKHAGAQLAYARADSDRDIATSHGFILLTPSRGDAMLRDEQVHKRPERRASFARKLHELMHAVLRVDHNAAKLIDAQPDGDAPELNPATLAFPFSSSLQRLARKRIYVGAERVTFDGIALPGDGTVSLVKVTGIPLFEFAGTTLLTADGHSRTYSFG
jgi:hypothetical protein